METKLSPNNEHSVKYTVEEQRNIIIDEIKKSQLNLQTNIQDDIIVGNCLNHILKEVSSSFVYPKFDCVVELGLKYALNNDELGIEQKIRVVKELAKISCRLMKFW